MEQVVLRVLKCC